MKTQHKIIYGMFVLFALAGTSSCQKGFEELNTPYKNPSVSTVTAAGLFNRLSSNVTNEDYTLAVVLFYPYTNQQGVQNTVAPYLNYTSSYWNHYYPDLLDYKKLLEFIGKQSSPQSYNNVKYMASILMGAKTLQMLDRYGDIPYTKAGSAEQGAEFYRPSYDKQADVYKSVLNDLKAAADGLSAGTDQINIGSSETFLSNDFTAWKKFANALRLRYAVRLYNKEQVMCSTIITDIIGGNKPLPNNQNTASLQKDNFGNFPNLISPAPDYVDRLWYAFRATSVSNIRMSSNVWGQMSSNNNVDGSGIYDPRCFVWFQTNDDDKWIPQLQNGSVSDGGDVYVNGNTARRPFGSNPANKCASFNFFLASDYKNLPYIIISEADVHLLKAEIYQRGMGVAKDIVQAKTEYEAGIKASVDFWYAYTASSSTWSVKPTAPTAAQMTAFLTAPNVQYNGANDAEALKKIATQGWLAAIFEPAEAWSIVRRTGLTPKDPTYTPAVTANKLPYPADESTNNNVNWMAATGGANSTVQMQTKVYWMP